MLPANILNLIAAFLGALRDNIHTAVVRGLGQHIRYIQTVEVPANGTAELRMRPGADVAMEWVDVQTDAATCYPTSAELNGNKYLTTIGDVTQPAAAPEGGPSSQRGYLVRPRLAANNEFRWTFRNDAGAVAKATVVVHGYSLTVQG